MIGFLLPPSMPKPEAAIVDTNSENAEVRWVSAQALGCVDGPLRNAAVDALNKLLSDPVAEVRAQAVEGMLEQSLAGAECARDWIANAGRDEAPCVRCAAVDAIAALVDEPTSLLTKSLSDDDSSVRLAAVESLGELGDGAALSSVLRLLDDGDDTVRLAAAIAAASLGDGSGEPLLLAALEKTSSDAAEICLSLGRIRSNSALDALRRAASGFFAPLHIKAAAAVALYACAEGKEGRDQIGRLLEAKKADTRLAIFVALCRLPVAGLSEETARAAEHRDEMVASSALQTLVALAAADPAALPALQQLRGRLTGAPAEELDDILITFKRNDG